MIRQTISNRRTPLGLDRCGEVWPRKATLSVQFVAAHEHPRRSRDVIAREALYEIRFSGVPEEHQAARYRLRWQNRRPAIPTSKAVRRSCFRRQIEPGPE